MAVLDPCRPTGVGFRESEREQVKEAAWQRRTSVTQLVRDSLMAYGVLSPPAEVMEQRAA